MVKFAHQGHEVFNVYKAVLSCSVRRQGQTDELFATYFALYAVVLRRLSHAWHPAHTEEVLGEVDTRFLNDHILRKLMLNSIVIVRFIVAAAAAAATSIADFFLRILDHQLSVCVNDFVFEVSIIIDLMTLTIITLPILLLVNTYVFCQALILLVNIIFFQEDKSFFDRKGSLTTSGCCICCVIERHSLIMFVHTGSNC